MANEFRNWSRDTEELATCFTVHARDLSGGTCVLSDADRTVAGDLVQAAFEAATTVWRTLRDLPADQCRGWLLDTLAAAHNRAGHPAGWLRIRPAGDGGRPGPAEPASQPGARLGGPRGTRLAGLRALAGRTPLNRATAHGVPAPAGAASGSGHGGSGSTPGSGAAVPPGSYGDPVSALYEEHYAPLVRLAALLVRDTPTAEQIVQDSFVAVAATWRRRDTDGALDLLRQAVLDRSRSALRHGITPAPAATGRPPGSPPLLAALGALPTRQREVLVLRYYANLSEAQAADTIGISRAAVRRHATRANAALRTLLDAG